MKCPNCGHEMKEGDMKPYSRKAAAAGHDVGKPNVPGKTGFKAVEAKAEREYGSEAAGKRVAGAVFARLASGGYKGKR